MSTKPPDATWPLRARRGALDSLRARRGALALAVLLAGLAGTAPAQSQIIIGGGGSSGDVFVGGAILFGPPIPRLPPLAAFKAEIATAGPPTSSGLIIYETPGLTWTCEGTRCGSQGRLDRLNLETCVALRQQVGPVVAMEAAGRGFSPEGIGQCNRAVAAVQPPDRIAPPERQQPNGSIVGGTGSGRITFPGQ